MDNTTNFNNSKLVCMTKDKSKRSKNTNAKYNYKQK